MIYSWFNSVIPIAAIFSFRMLGLFMLIPVFTVLGEQLSGSTPALIGIALGSYGLSQGILQMPFGLLSDRFGRKPMITIGLILFALGSLLGAMTHSIYGMIIARVLQGTGAIGSVLIALMADLTPDSQRTKAMAVVGMTIGISFSLAMILSPILTHYYGLSAIFYLTAVFALLGLLLLHTVIPTPVNEYFHSESETNPALLKPVLKDRQLQRLNLGIFMQHFILTSTFYAIPLILKQLMLQGYLTVQWHFYLPLLLGSFIVMIPFIYLAERHHKMRPVFLGAVATIFITELFLAIFYSGFYHLLLLMFLYFVAFNLLEATLPSLISKQAGKLNKGTALGVYSTCQFLGIFIGGSTAGIVYQHQGIRGVFILNAVFSLTWLITTWSMQFKNKTQESVIKSTQRE